MVSTTGKIQVKIYAVLIVFLYAVQSLNVVEVIFISKLCLIYYTL